MTIFHLNRHKEPPSSVVQLFIMHLQGMKTRMLPCLFCGCDTLHVIDREEDGEQVSTCTVCQTMQAYDA